MHPCAPQCFAHELPELESLGKYDGVFISGEAGAAREARRCQLGEVGLQGG